MRKWIAVAALSVVGIIGMGGDALAHTKAFDREITAALGGSGIEGDIDSAKSKCFAGVRVDLVNENGEGGIVDTEFTNLDGEYSFENVETGVYRTVAPRFVFRKTAAHKHVCRKVTNEVGILVA